MSFHDIWEFWVLIICAAERETETVFPYVFLFLCDCTVCAHISLYECALFVLFCFVKFNVVCCW